jgi:NTP pyrophosphatase (non-canonical NTP hydrolase)
MAKLTFNEYQGLAARTANKHDNEEYNYILGLDGETGELVDAVKKCTFHGHVIDKVYVKKEAGDVLWYSSQLARLFDIDLSDTFDKFDQMRELYDNTNQKQVMIISSINISKAVGIAAAFMYERINGNFLHRLNLERQLVSILTDLSFLLIIAGLDIREVAQANLDKLMARYPEGFSEERSINREED